MCRVGKMKMIWGYWDSNVCWRCGKKETVNHVLAFQDEDTVQVFYDSVELMEEWMVKIDTGEDSHKASPAILERRPLPPLAPVGMTRLCGGILLRRRDLMASFSRGLHFYFVAGGSR